MAFLLLGALGFASGIICRSFFIFPVLVFGFPIAVGVGLLVLAWQRNSRAVCLIALCLLGVGIGGIRTAFVPSTLPEAFMPMLGSTVVLEGVVVREPDIRETSQRITVLISKDGVRTRVLLVGPLYPEVSYGMQLSAEGQFKQPEPFSTDGGRTFAYDQFLSKDGVFAMLTTRDITILAPAQGLHAHTIQRLLSLKHAFVDGLSTALPEPSASLAAGLITGGKQGLGPELLQAFIVTGLVHIVVLSGYNVMIVAEAVLRSLQMLPKRIGALTAGITIVLFVLIAGAGSASIRAGIMASLAVFARATGRTYAVLYALLIAFIGMLLWNPLLLLFDPGFILSFAATLGLILIAPVLEDTFSWIRSVFWRGLLASTLAAQLAVLPLLLYQSGVLSFVSIPANLVVLPLVPPAMALGALAGGIGMLVPDIAPWVGLPAFLLLSAIIAIAEYASALPLAAVTLPAFPFWVVPLLYICTVLGLFLLARLNHTRLRDAPVNVLKER